MRFILATTLLVLVAATPRVGNFDLRRFANQVARQQNMVEEQTRLFGGSGINVMRRRQGGTKPFYSSSHSDHLSMASMHIHAEFFNTLGMGEISAVLNGVSFTTRHNDYLYVRRADAGAGFDDTVEIPYPPVPPEVLNARTVAKQMIQMRRYFEAFAKQDISIVDYRPYFKASLCYMEGYWTKAEPDTIQEAFFSERHHYAAYSWDNLAQNFIYQSASGAKENLENLASMPTKIFGVGEDGKLVIGQWNYKILCHPLKDDLPTNRLILVDDLKTRMTLGVSYKDHGLYRNARYNVNVKDSDTFTDQSAEWNFLDSLMEQIPGPSGYGAVLHDLSFGNQIRHYNNPAGSTTQLNAAYYHRWFENEKVGAMGVHTRPRGMSDDNMWVAMTSRPNIIPSYLEMCDRNGSNCQTLEQTYSYAIPMEIIYSTPLMNWNPYNIEYKGLDSLPLGKSAYAGPGGPTSRNGSATADTAYNGTNSAKFYRIPYDFFTGTEWGKDPADTTKDFVYVLNKDGVMYQVRASAFRTFLPEIRGIGRIRQRYPIHPIHGEGTPVWQELSALAEIVMNPTKYAHMIRNP